MDATRLTSLKLAKAGYGHGDPQSILGWPVDLAFDTLAYERFIEEYLETRNQLNAPKK
jgi:hypothetical protein